MKEIISIATVLFLLVGCSSQETDDGVMSSKGKVYTINTTTICNARGYHGTTPITVTVRKNRIVSVEALPNHETPRFFDSVKRYMLPKFKDVKFKDYATVDCVSGATISSKSVRENIKAAYDYYTKHK
jgi:electron transport complex protein RnfG